MRDVISAEHLHGLGKLLFAFAVFWGYIWFCQYMLIWYTNIPEETQYFMVRHGGNMGPIAMASLALNWLIPFLVLLPRPCKRNEKVLLGISVVVLVGHWLDLYGMIMPPFTGGTPSIGLWELAGIALIVGTTGLLATFSFRRHPPVPKRDPLLAESLHHHQ